MEGLNKTQLEYRIHNGLVNNENIKNSRSIKDIILSNTITLFNLLHIVLFILVLTTGSLVNATFIASIFFNTIIGIYQEIKAKIIIDKLKITTTNTVTVIREGKKEVIKPEEIVLDDVMYLNQGDSLVVDAMVIQSNYLEVDESVVTGESDAMPKHENDKLISGSIVTSGSCYAKVTSINKDTYANNLIKEASEVSENSSYLMSSINSILKVVTFLIIPTGILLFITQFVYNGQNYAESVLSSIAGVIGMIPEGLVLLTSISLTVGVIKMANKKVIIQKLSGIELLACVDVLCLDKTGTITDGSLKVEHIIYKVKDKDKINNIIANMVNTSGNATDNAICKVFKKKEELEVLDRVPFNSSRKYALTKFKNGTYALGSLDNLTDKEYNDYPELKDYIDNGLRNITVCACEEKFNKKTNEIVAFIILKDTIRKSAKETLEYFKKQDVDIKIISDNGKQFIKTNKY